MEEFEYRTLPEYKQWAKAVGSGLGLQAEVKPLRVILDRVRVEGCTEEAFFILWKIFLSHCRHGDRDGAINVLHEMHEAQVTIKWGDYQIGQVLLDSLNAPDLAEVYVQRGLDVARSETDVAEKNLWESRLTALHLAVLTARNAPASEVNEVIGRLESLVSTHLSYDEFLIRSLEQLLDTAEVNRKSLGAIVAHLEVTISLQEERYGSKFPERRQRVEALCRRLEIDD